jgi:molecular chaperone Hsp33
MTAHIAATLGTDTNLCPLPGQVSRFLIESANVRGALVHLGMAWETLQAGRAYPPAVADLLGEICAMAALLGAQLKQKGRLTLQMQGGSGPVSLLVVDCTEDLGLRAYARHDAVGEATTLSALTHDSLLALTLDVQGLDQPWQSLVPKEGETVSAVFEQYLALSEQQPTRVWLTAGPKAAAGLFLQALPPSPDDDPDGWNRATRLAETVKPDELLGCDAHTLLTRLFHEETVRVFEPCPVHAEQRYQPERVQAVLHSLGESEVRALQDENGCIEMRDDLSNLTYTFGPEEIDALFTPVSNRPA